MTDPDPQPLKFQTQEEEMMCEYLYIINHSTFSILVPGMINQLMYYFVFTQKFHNLLLNDNNKTHHAT